MANNLGILNSVLPRDGQWAARHVALHVSVLHGTTRVRFGGAHYTVPHDTHVGWVRLRILGMRVLKTQRD